MWVSVSRVRVRVRVACLRRRPKSLVYTLASVCRRDLTRDVLRRRGSKLLLGFRGRGRGRGMGMGMGRGSTVS